MKYLQSDPMVFGSTRSYASAWERTFGKKEVAPQEQEPEAQRNNRHRVVMQSIKKGRVK